MKDFRDTNFDYEVSSFGSNTTPFGSSTKGPLYKACNSLNGQDISKKGDWIWIPYVPKNRIKIKMPFGTIEGRQFTTVLFNSRFASWSIPIGKDRSRGDICCLPVIVSTFMIRFFRLFLVCRFSTSLVFLYPLHH